MKLCAMEWGSDDRWLGVEIRSRFRYTIYQYETGSGELVEISDRRQPGMGVLEVCVTLLADPGHRLSDLYGPWANTDHPCVREGQCQNRKNTKFGNGLHSTD